MDKARVCSRLTILSYCKYSFGSPGQTLDFTSRNPDTKEGEPVTPNIDPMDAGPPDPEAFAHGICSPPW